MRTSAPEQAFTPGATSASAPPARVLVVLNSICFYGLERAVVETFDALRHLLQAVVVIPQAAERHRLHLSIPEELRKRDLAVEFFSDYSDWPRIGRPRSVRQACEIIGVLLKANRDLCRAARNADVIYIPIITGLLFSFLISAWFRMRGGKVVYSFHELEVKRSLLLRIGTLWVSDCIHMTQRSMEMVLAANPYLHRKRNYVIPPVVDLSNRATAARSVAPAARGRSILFVGQVSKTKGIDVLIEAFRRIAPDFPDATLQIAGGASWEYGGSFEQAVDAAGLDGRIRHWGYVADVEPLFQSSYIYVHPTLPSLCHESFGRGAVEAMSLGVPTICFRSGALTEIVRHDETGWICEEETAECLAAALAQILADPAKQNYYSRNCVQRFRETYSTEQIQRRWEVLISGGGAE